MWTTETPTTPGHYWFYGCPWSRKSKADMYLVKVKRSGGEGLFYVTDGNFMYPRDASGYWLDAELPKPPDVRKAIEGGENDN